MGTILIYFGLLIAALYFIGFGIVMIMGLFDRTKDSTMDNKVVVLLLIIVMLVVPAFGIVSYLTHQ